MNDRMRYYASMGSLPCACGCGQMVPPGARYASASHRARAYDQRNPRVSKAPLEVLEQSLREALAASEEGFARQREDKARRPRKPRVHIDVLAEDAELLDRLARSRGLTRTGYVRELLRAAARDETCPRCRGRESYLRPGGNSLKADDWIICELCERRYAAMEQP